MPVTFPIVTLTVLVALALIAREFKFGLTSASLMVVTGTMACWFAIVLWISG